MGSWKRFARVSRNVKVERVYDVRKSAGRPLIVLPDGCFVTQSVGRGLAVFRFFDGEGTLVASATSPYASYFFLARWQGGFVVVGTMYGADPVVTSVSFDGAISYWTAADCEKPRSFTVAQSNGDVFVATDRQIGPGRSDYESEVLEFDVNGKGRGVRYRFDRRSSGTRQVLGCAVDKDGEHLALVEKPFFSSGISSGGPDREGLTGCWTRTTIHRRGEALGVSRNEEFEFPFGKSTAELMDGERYRSGRPSVVSYDPRTRSFLWGWGDGTLRRWGPIQSDTADSDVQDASNPTVLARLGFAIGGLESVGRSLLVSGMNRCALIDDGGTILREIPGGPPHLRVETGKWIVLRSAADPSRRVLVDERGSDVAAFALRTAAFEDVFTLGGDRIGVIAERSAGWLVVAARVFGESFDLEDLVEAPGEPPVVNVT